MASEGNSMDLSLSDTEQDRKPVISGTKSSLIAKAAEHEKALESTESLLRTKTRQAAELEENQKSLQDEIAAADRQVEELMMRKDQILGRKEQMMSDLKYVQLELDDVAGHVQTSELMVKQTKASCERFLARYNIEELRKEAEQEAEQEAGEGRESENGDDARRTASASGSSSRVATTNGNEKRGATTSANGSAANRQSGTSTHGAAKANGKNTAKGNSEKRPAEPKKKTNESRPAETSNVDNHRRIRYTPVAAVPTSPASAPTPGPFASLERDILPSRQSEPPARREPETEKSHTTSTEPTSATSATETPSAGSTQQSAPESVRAKRIRYANPQKNAAAAAKRATGSVVDSSARGQKRTREETETTDASREDEVEESPSSRRSSRLGRNTNYRTPGYYKKIVDGSGGK